MQNTREKVRMKVKDILYTRFAHVILSRFWWNQYFNGQIKRSEFISSCLRQNEFTDIIETGTFLGSSTIALAALSESRVHSIEINSRFIESAKTRITREYPNLDINLYHGSSANVLEQILSAMDPRKQILFLYLDAHWGENLPLISEIEALNRWGGKFVALIDDFQITGDAGYGYDVYSGHAVGPDLVPLTNKTHLYRLRAESSFETGAKRGSGIVIHEELLKNFSQDLLSLICEITDK
jgi:hypothetical protein